MSADACPRLVGIGVGPGDPELVTVKAVRMLREADLVLVPVMDLDDTGRAEATVRAHLDGPALERMRRVRFALNERHDPRRREAAWDDAARVVVDTVAEGSRTVAFATIGDPNVYATFTYLAQTVRDLLPDVVVETVPGVTAMQDLAARSGTVLAEGRQSVALLPITAGIEGFERALAGSDTVVAYKGGRMLPDLRRAVHEAGRLERAVFGAALGLPEQMVCPLAEVPEGPAAYLSTVIVPGAGGSRGSRL